MTKPITDEWDVKFIYLTKTANHTIEDYLKLWGERCGVDHTNRDIPKYMAIHFLELLLSIHPNPSRAMLDIFNDGDPDGVLNIILKRVGKEDSQLKYWERILMSIASQFAITPGKYLPGYVKSLRALGYNVPLDWVEY